MRDTRLIFVEGVIGAGKSTTVAKIADRLGAVGVSARQVNEGDERLRVAKQTAHGYMPWLDLSTRQYVEHCRRNWRVFVTAQGTDQSVTVCDGLLFHGNLTDLLMMDADAPTVASYFKAIVSELSALRPCVIYLCVSDVAHTIHQICLERGPAWETRQLNWKLGSPFATAAGLHGVAGLAAFYERFARTCDSLLVMNDLPTLRVADDRSWAERERVINDWLGLNS